MLGVFVKDFTSAQSGERHRKGTGERIYADSGSWNSGIRIRGFLHSHRNVHWTKALQQG